MQPHFVQRFSPSSLPKRSGISETSSGQARQICQRLVASSGEALPPPLTTTSLAYSASRTTCFKIDGCLVIVLIREEAPAHVCEPGQAGILERGLDVQAVFLAGCASAKLSRAVGRKGDVGHVAADGVTVDADFDRGGATLQLEGVTIFVGVERARHVERSCRGDDGVTSGVGRQVDDGSSGKLRAGGEAVRVKFPRRRAVTVGVFQVARSGDGHAVDRAAKFPRDGER